MFCRGAITRGAGAITRGAGAINRAPTTVFRLPARRAETALIVSIPLLLLLVTSCSKTPSRRSVSIADSVAAAATSQQAVGAAARTHTPTPTPIPTPSPTPTVVPAQSYFPAHRIVAFYGNPLSPILGVLGEGNLDQVVARLRQQAAAYAQADPTRQVTPALELIESVAQDTPTDNGLYLYDTDPAVVDQYQATATQNGMMLILDEQIGRSTPEAEVQRILPRLSAPNVGIALDPEFEMPPGEVPGTDIGSITAAQINDVQAMLEDVAVRNGLPSKLLIVHQFQFGMIVHPEQLRSYPHVDLVLNADGFGDRETKLEKYQALITNRPLGHAGVKLFYKYDADIWAPADVLQLNPPPDVVIYQ
jgi:hypothetical protein